MRVDQALADAGFAIVHRFAVDAVVHEPGLERLASAPLGILIGNTRTLWPRFLERADTAIANPLDTYTEQTIDRLVPAGGRCYYSHRRYDGSFVPFQRLAVAAGLGALSPTQLVIHPTYGAWFALRAVVVCGGTPPETLPVERACRCDGSCQDALTRAITATGPDNWRAWLAVRDACTAGRDWRYDEDQIRYHYTKTF